MINLNFKSKSYWNHNCLYFFQDVGEEAAAAAAASKDEPDDDEGIDVESQGSEEDLCFNEKNLKKALQKVNTWYSHFMNCILSKIVIEDFVCVIDWKDECLKCPSESNTFQFVQFLVHNS